jgi:multidrug transporter EmrE-like cation transporter
VLLFLANGLGGIFAKTHQINVAAIDAIDFTVVIQSATMVYTIIALVVYWLVKKRQSKTVEASSGLTLSRLFHDKLIVYVVGFSLFSSTGYLLQLMSAVHLPATVMYPIVTGGSVVLTSIAGKVFFREKMSKLALISISLAFVATILFAL